MHEQFIEIESHFTLARDTRSGFMLYLSHPNIVPSLPNAQITLTLTVNEETKTLAKEL